MTDASEAAVERMESVELADGRRVSRETLRALLAALLADPEDVLRLLAADVNFEPYYDLDGQPISRDERAAIIARKHAARSQGVDGASSPENDPTRIGWDERAGVTVSTVWLGLDHSFGDGPPVIFETMIFGGDHDEDQWRYSTRAQAEAGHAAAVELAFAPPVSSPHQGE